MRQHTLRGRAEHTATHRCGTIKSLYLLLVRPTGGWSPQKGCRVPAESRQGGRSVAATGVRAGHSRPGAGCHSPAVLKPGEEPVRSSTASFSPCSSGRFRVSGALCCPAPSSSMLHRQFFHPECAPPSSTHTNWQLKFNIFSRGKTISEIKPVMVANCPSGSRRFPREPGRLSSLWCGCRGCPGWGQ